MVVTGKEELSNEKFIKNFGSLRGGGTLGFAGGQEARKARCQASYVIMNLFQNVLFGRLEDKRVRRYAIIGVQSSRNICHCEGVKRPWQSQNSEVLSIVKPHPTPLFRPLPQYLLNFKTPEQVFLKDRESNSLKRTYSPIDLFTYSLKKKAAFTLAEVLITLGIIGVVAAITLPSLINSYQKMVLRQQFKKAYNTMLNGYRLAEVNLGYHPMCYYGDDHIGASCLKYENGECVEYGDPVNPTNQSSDCSVLRTELQKTLKVIKVCEGNGLADGCIPPYKGNDTIYKENNENASEEDVNMATTAISGWREQNIQNKSHIWVLSDGIIIVWYSDSTKLFAVDVNGMKGPNKWGYDLFGFKLVSNLAKTLWLDGAGTIDKGGTRTTEMMQSIGL